MDASAPRVAAKDRALAHVRERILDGRYPGGSLLSEGEVAEDLGLSRTPVREAFLLLEAEGLMRLYPKRGALVVAVSPDEVRDVMETRMLVERHAVRRVAAEGPDVGARLGGLLRAQAERAAAGDLAGFADADREFHRTLVEAAGNAILTRLYDSLRDRQRRMGTASIVRDPSLVTRFLDEHRLLAAAVRDRDPDAAERVLVAHLEAAHGGIRGALPGS